MQEKKKKESNSFRLFNDGSFTKCKNCEIDVLVENPLLLDKQGNNREF